MSDLAFDRDVSKIIRRLNRLPKEYDKARRSLLKRAAKPVVKAIKGKVRVGTKPHKRYTKDGKHVATYYPGNLKRSIRTLRFKGSKDLFVGPRLARKGSSHGSFRGNKVDGYYGHIVEYGSIKQSSKPFMRPGFRASKARAARIIQIGSSKILRQYARRYRTS